MLRKLQPPTGVAARFEDDSFTVGRIGLKDRLVVSVLNFSDTPKMISFRLAVRSRITELWSGSDLGVHDGTFELKDVAPHSGKLLVCEQTDASKHPA